ncbi:hypothetical protein Q4566_01890 [Tamlana sp. 2_MG-2023]|uniref:hypothetical protein n=1 Tax=unclassified Tamlana TaxID=2614803 RepID=UPI0026E308B0|nr:MULTISPECIES: hypothetical protein [unclassified Tamlana]MDO6758936.1 hypothetical protein [Tamlana sp. 2_MG-2023]MDO6789635.1 hypothetical protein [Tamlana sp. 1_MG-2023]
MKKLIVPILALLFIACDQEDVDDVKNAANPDDSIEAVREYAFVNQIFQDIGNNTGDAVLTSENSQTSKISGAKNSPDITIEPFDLISFPKTITVDFGEGLLCEDGITRKGIVTIVSTNWYRQEGSVHTSTFENYYHEDYKVEGTHVAENLGENADGFLEYGVTINDGKITTETGESIQYNEDSMRTWVSGFDTPLHIWDDEYLLDGKQSGESSKGVDYTLTVDESLHFVLLPRQVKSGILSLDVGLFKDIKLDYADKTITVLGTTYPFVD